MREEVAFLEALGHELRPAFAPDLAETGRNHGLMMEGVPRVTILMPVKAYHRPYLEQALGSVLGQTSPAWRLLVIVEARDLEHFAAILGDRLADSRIGIVVNEGRALAGKLNTGMRRATTDFAASLFADDLWAPKAVEVLTRYIEAFPHVDFFNASRRYIDDDGRPISGIHTSVQVHGPEDFVNGSPAKHLLCWRVSKALSIGGIDESLNSVGPDDWDFPWVMAEQGAVFLAVEECLYLYRDHRRCSRLTTHLPLSVHKREMRRIMEKHGVDRRTIDARLASAERHFLRQCLYRSRFDRWLKQRVGYQPTGFWREPYR
jgi:glycosyltransferase involved in cell wall biosynthesis